MTVALLAAAAEEALPKFLGVGFPVLLTAVQMFAVSRPAAVMMFAAIVSGALEDAISSLPMMTSISYFLAVAILTRWTDIPRSATILTYPLYHLWLWVWVADLEGGLFSRVAAALPIGVVTAVAVAAVVPWIERKVAVDEQG
jgi:hypothetical protein